MGEGGVNGLQFLSQISFPEATTLQYTNLMSLSDKESVILNLATIFMFQGSISLFYSLGP